ncbi:MAG: iron ABC transporter permease [Dehalococcoidia bacterium]|nr:iron ABC transporter permease [Dehalococcoidia bacterium]
MSAVPIVERRRPVANVYLGPVAFRVDVRCLALIAGGLAVLAVLAAWTMTLGSFPIPLTEVVKSTVGAGKPEHEFIVRELRLPRVLCAVLVGALLATAGAVFQGVVRNPLVSPDIIGIDAGASLVAVWWIVTGRDTTFLPVVAFGGAAAAAMGIYLVTWRGGVAPGRLILVGIGVNALLGAATTFLMTRYPIERVSNAMLWTTGSVYATSWADVRVLAGTLGVLLPLTVSLMWPLRVLQFGDDTAKGMGMRVEVVRLGLLLSGCGLAAVAVSIAGPVGFVAFVVPHIARMLAGPMTGGVLVLTAVAGGILLLAADTVGQHFLPVALPVGVVTAALGAPYFLFLLYRVNARL